MKQCMLAELSKGVINFNRLIKRNQKMENKTTKPIKLSTRKGVSRNGRIFSIDEKLKFPLVLACVSQNPYQVSFTALTTLGTRRR